MGKISNSVVLNNYKLNFEKFIIYLKLNIFSPSIADVKEARNELYGNEDKYSRTDNAADEDMHTY